MYFCSDFLWLLLQPIYTCFQSSAARTSETSAGLYSETWRRSTQIHIPEKFGVNMFSGFTHTVLSTVKTPELWLRRVCFGSSAMCGQPPTWEHNYVFVFPSVLPLFPCAPCMITNINMEIQQTSVTISKYEHWLLECKWKTDECTPVFSNISKKVYPKKYSCTLNVNYFELSYLRACQCLFKAHVCSSELRANLFYLCQLHPPV